MPSEFKLQWKLVEDHLECRWPKGRDDEKKAAPLSRKKSNSALIMSGPSESAMSLLANLKLWSIARGLGRVGTTRQII